MKKNKKGAKNDPRGGGQRRTDESISENVRVIHSDEPNPHDG